MTLFINSTVMATNIHNEEGNSEKYERLVQEEIEFVNPETLKLSDFKVDEKHIVPNEGRHIGYDDLNLIKQGLNDDISILNDNNIVKTKSLSSIEYQPDAYEPNDTFEQAFPYSRCKKMTGNSFIEGYINAGIHNSTDNDVYSINLTSDKEYFFHLKNLVEDYDMWVVDPTMNSYWDITETGSSEEYFYFTPPTNGTYYIIIWGNGNSNYNNYFLYAGESVVTKTLEESTGLTFKFNGAGATSYLTYDTTGKIPSDAILNSVRIDSNGSGYWVGLTKYLKSTNGSIYTNQDRTGLDSILYKPETTGYERASQQWQISGKCSSGTSNFTWQPNIKIQYTYVMKP